MLYCLSLSELLSDIMISKVNTIKMEGKVFPLLPKFLSCSNLHYNKESMFIIQQSSMRQ